MPIARIIILLLILLPLACAPVNAEQMTIKLNIGLEESSLKQKACEYFKRLAEQRSDNRVQIEIIRDQAPENSQTLIAALKDDRFQMAVPAIRVLAEINPQLQLFDLPFLFKNAAHLHRIIDGSVGATLLKGTQQQNLIAHSFWDNGWNQIAANQILLSPTAAKDLEFTTSSRAIGPELFHSLSLDPQENGPNNLTVQRNAQDLKGSENTLNTIYTQGIYKIQPDITLTNHSVRGYLVVTSTRLWLQLPADLKVILLGAIKDAAEYTREMARETGEQALEKLRATGTTNIHKLNSKEHAGWANSLQNTYPQVFDRIDSRLIQQALTE